MTSVVIDINEPVATNSYPSFPAASGVNLPKDSAPRPISIPASQLYYWTQAWQAGEREADQDREKGDIVRFADPDDAIRWLLGAD